MEIALVIGILIAAIILFASEKFSVDLVALMVLGALLLFGLVTVDEGISGLSNPATVTVAAMFILSAGLQKTGVVSFAGRALIRLGKNHILLMFLIMAAVGIISAFINNTAAVAVFLPMVIGAAAARKISPSKLLIPLSFAAQFGGVCTLIGTSTNLLVSSISERSGYGAFSMFEFSYLGLILAGAGMIYFLIAGRWLLPSRRGPQLTETYQLGQYITELRVLEESPLVGQTILLFRLGEKYDVTVIEILRDNKTIWSPLSEPVRPNDILLVRGKVQNLMDLKAAAKLEIEPEFKLKDETLFGEDLSLIEVLVAPRSRLIGHTLADLNFRRRFNAVVLAMQRRERALGEKLARVRLRFGDSLLLLVPTEEIAQLRSDENLIVLAEVDESYVRRHKAPIALAIISLVVFLGALDILPVVVAAIIGAAAMALTKCITLEEAYAAIDWRVIILLAGILPLGIAMEKWGVAQLIAQYGFQMVGQFGPIAFLALLYLLTATLTESMSNNAAAVLLAPIAISSALSLNADPKPFLMAVTFAASTSFATPIGYQTNTMVYNPGGYKFTDFMKIGIPLNFLFWILAVIFIPIFWPF